MIRGTGNRSLFDIAPGKVRRGRSHELWLACLHTRHASINELAIKENDRKFHWPLGRRPDEHPGLSDLGL